MRDERVDLSALDPAADEIAWERSLQAITVAAAPELARRAAARSPFVLLAGWARPALAAAATLAAVSLGGLWWAGGDGAPELVWGVAEELGLPAPVADWVAEGRPPTEEDLLLAMEVEQR